MEHSRLGIPILIDLEASHGMQALGSVVYPTNICSGCSFDADLYGKMMALIAKELRLSGTHIGFMTIIDMATDPRFGRTEESSGEDPLLASRMAFSAVKGFERENTSICAKHFLAHGGATSGHMCGEVCSGIRNIHEIHIPPAKAAIEAFCNATAETVSLQEINRAMSEAVAACYKCRSNAVMPENREE